MSRRPHRKACSIDDEYDGAETEFIRACLAYRQEHKLAFLNAVDYYAVLMSLGYVRRAEVIEPPAGES